MGIIHRDIKAENIIFLTGDAMSEIKLADFGQSKKYDKSDKSDKSNTILGTPYYVTPEVLDGKM